MSRRLATIAWSAGLALVLALPALASGELETRLEKSAVRVGEPVRLMLSQSGDAAPAQPDWTPLDEDFELLDVQRSTRISVVNGVGDQHHDWIVTLLPRRAGTLRIPPLRAGNLESQERSLEVSDAPAAGSGPPATGSGGAAAGEEPAVADASTGPPFRVEMEVDDRKPYVHGSVRLTVRLLAAENFLEGGLSEPQVDGALVRRVGSDRDEQREIDGRLYRVVEREYALAPQRSGRLHIDPPVFEALVRDRQARRPSPRGSLLERFFGGDPMGDLLADSFSDPFFSDPFGGSLLSRLGGPTRPVRVAAAPLDLSVRARPAEADGAWWLPARDVEISESWDPDPPVFRVGEPVQRHVVLRADGLAADQLPQLDLPEPDGLRQYLEPAREDTRVEGGGLRAQQVVDSTLIPTRPGDFELPAVEVSWWDVGAERARTARLPARSIRVVPGAAPISEPAEAHPIPGVEAEASPAPVPTWVVPASAAALLLGVIGGAGLALRRRRRAGRSPLPARRRPAERALARACRRGDARAAAEACRRLAALDGVRGSLAEHAARQGRNELADALRELDRVRYAPEASTTGRWDGRVLWRAWRRSRRRRRRRRGAPAPVLPALYPES